MEDEIALHYNGSSGHSLRGMESVIATVSGYHGLERFKLIKLINYTGASYVGAMSKSTTHLVCWRLEGRKYELAMKFGTIIVSHRWFEDCVKAGKRLPERHYIMKSGQQAGPLSWEVPDVGEKESPLARKNGIVLSDLSNMCKPTRDAEKNAECNWSASALLSENLYPALGTRIASHKIENTMVHKKSKQVHRQSNKHFLMEQSSSGLVDRQHGESSSYPSKITARHKRNVCSDVETSITARKGRRLVKKNACRGLESPISNSEQDWNPNNLGNEDASTVLGIDQDHFLAAPTSIDNLTTEIIDLDSCVNDNIPILQARTSRDSICSGENRNEVVQNVEGIAEINKLDAASDINNLGKEEMLSQDRFPDSEENLDGTQEVDAKLERSTRLPASDPSCIICWTDFSSTRGVLSCGHRFCYSCIQTWADFEASRRKVSACPLCKANFSIITKVDCAVSSDQKMYSQTIPCDSSVADIFVLPDLEFSRFQAQSSAALVCCECRSREPEDLLIHCHVCSSRSIHRYCLDPYLIPWTCSSCKGLGMLYRNL